GLQGLFPRVLPTWSMAFDSRSHFQSPRFLSYITIAHSAGMFHDPVFRTGGVPEPPYRMSSLDQSSSQCDPVGGASKGSGAGRRSKSWPKFTMISRSPKDPPKKRSRKASEPSTAP